MKILITGVTDTHVNKATRVPSTKFTSIPVCLADAMRTMDHYVDHREVTPGESLASYDRVICFLYPKDRHARHPEGALHVLESRPDALIGIDDWAAPAIVDTWEMPELAQRRWIAPVYKWGNPSRLRSFLKLDDVVCYDPSPMVGASPVADPFAPRVRTWLNASFHASTHVWAAENTKWPLLSYGCKPLLQARILESDANELYTKVAGCLAPPYEISGTGWWRVRYLFASRAGAVIGCAPNEFCDLGIEFQHPISLIEDCSDASLATLATAQRKLIERNVGTFDDMCNAVTTMLK